jgi:hypothetical protein
VAGIMNAERLPAEFVLEAQRSLWEQTHDAWLIFARGGLAEESTDSLYRQAHQLAPEIVPAEYFLEMQRMSEVMGTASSAGRGPAEMERALREAAGQPWTGEGNMQLAALLESQGRLGEASEQARLAVSKQPRAADSHMILAILSFKQQDFAGARRAFACELRPDRPKLYIEFEQALRERGF